MSTKTSPVWNFFTESSEFKGKATCNICKWQLSFRTTTTNLMRHIRRKHPEVNVENSKKIPRMWLYFTKSQSDDSLAACNICNKEISFKSNMSNLKKHLIRLHPEQLLEGNCDLEDADDISGENSDLIVSMKCSFCLKTFISKSNLINHIKNHIQNKELIYDGSDSELKEIFLSSDDELRSKKQQKEFSSTKYNFFKTTTDLWEFFTKIHDSDLVACCSLCQIQLSYKSNTNNLKNHLEQKHPEVLKIYEGNKQLFITEASFKGFEENKIKSEEYVSENIFVEELNIGTDMHNSRSQIWNVFTIKSASDCIATCNICDQQFSFKSTTNDLKRHFQRKHPDLLMESKIEKIKDLSEEQEPVYQEPNNEFEQKKDAEMEGKEVEQQYELQADPLLLEDTKVFQNLDTATSDQNQQVVGNIDDWDNDFWNLNHSDGDDDPDFRPSPTFDEVANIKNTSITKKRSQIWNVFTRKPNSDCVAICNVCNQEFSHRSTTNNLKKHFKRKHPDNTFNIKIERVKEVSPLSKCIPKYLVFKDCGIWMLFKGRDHTITINSNIQTDSTSGIHKTDAEDDDERDSSDGNTKRKRSQICKYFTRKKPGEYVAICNICKKELGFRSTTSNLKKHLDRKHPNVKMKNENNDEEKKTAPEVRVKTCLVCLQNDQTESREFLQINNANSKEEKSYMIKIQEVMNQSVVINESHVICLPCVDDLEKVIQFREKVFKAFEFWSKVEPEPEMETYDNDADDNHSDCSDLEDGESLDKFTCSKCNKVFPSPSIMLKHNCGQQSRKERPCMKKDSTQETFYCEFCGKSFNIKWKLNKHLKICQSNSSKQFSCNLCNRIFKKAYHLREHMASHTGERRSSLKHKHMRSHNAKPGEKSKKTPFLCTICGKSFHYSNGASRHMRVHLGERRYQCHICLKKFSQSTHLKVHLRTHSGERPYGCMICGRTFSLNASLRKHMRLHVGSGDFVKLGKNLETGFPHTDMVTEDGLQILTAVSHAPQEIDVDGNPCIG